MGEEKYAQIQYDGDDLENVTIKEVGDTPKTGSGSGDVALEGIAGIAESVREIVKMEKEGKDSAMAEAGLPRPSAGFGNPSEAVQSTSEQANAGGSYFGQGIGAQGRTYFGQGTGAQGGSYFGQGIEAQGGTYFGQNDMLQQEEPIQVREPINRKNPFQDAYKASERENPQEFHKAPEGGNAPDEAKPQEAPKPTEAGNPQAPYKAVEGVNVPEPCKASERTGHSETDRAPEGTSHPETDKVSEGTSDSEPDRPLQEAHKAAGGIDASGKPSQNAASQEMPATEERMGRMEESLENISRIMRRLEKKFETEILNSQTRDNTVKTIYKELNEYKAGLIEKALKEVLYDFIDIREMMFSKAKYMQKEGEAAVISLEEFLSYAEDIGDILEKHDVSIYKGEPGTRNVATKQKIVRKVETEDESLAKTVAESLSYGYEYNGKVIYPEKISIYVKKK